MMKTLNLMFKNVLTFHDTRRRRDIAPPQRPDISVTYPEHYANPQTVLAVIELKDRALDSSAFGQVINAVRLVHLKLLEKRDMWGFVLNGTDENFVFHLFADGGIFFLVLIFFIVFVSLILLFFFFFYNVLKICLNRTV